MKKIVSIITVLLAVLFVQAQTITQNGVSYRYNGKNPRTPIGGVYIKPVTADNGVVSNASNGSFSVVLKNLKMGSRIGNVKVAKQGMMVFNQQAVDEWNVRKDPLCLILCDANEFQKQKKNLIAIGERQAKKKYDKKLAELKKRNEAQQLQIDDYYNKLDSLEKEYQNALKHMDEYADVFARIDESEIDTLAQRAIELFNKGEIDESIRLFEQGNYMKKLDDALHTKAQAQNLRNVADSAEALADKDIEECVKSIKAQVSAYQVKNDYEKVGELLKGMADKLQTSDAIWDYILFNKMQNKFKEEELYSYKLFQLIEQGNYQKKEILLLPLYITLGDLSCNLQDFSDSENILKTALEICCRQSKDNPDLEPGLLFIYKSLGQLYQKMHRLGESEAMYKSELEVYERLSKNNPKVYDGNLADLYDDLGVLYYDLHRFSDSEAMYKSALEIRKRLAVDNPKVYEPGLATSYNNLGNLYYDTKRFNDSEIMEKSSLEILEHLSKDNPDVYESDIATCYDKLGSIYSKMQRFTDSETMYKLALEIRKRLSKNNPKVYDGNLAASYNNLGVLYCTIQRYTDSEAMYKLALGMRNQLATDNPKAYEEDLASSYNNLGNLYCDTQRYTDSEAMYKSALEIRKRLATDNPKAYEEDLACSYNNLGLLYRKILRFSDSETMYKLALEIIERLSKDNPKDYEDDLIGYYTNLGNLYSATERFGDSEKIFLSCLDIYSKMYEKNPQSYGKKMANLYYNIGTIRTKNRKNIMAINAFENSLKLIKKNAIREKEDSALYAVNLQELIKLYNSEKNYEAAYNYNAELLKILKSDYLVNPEKFKNAYTVFLSSQSFYANLLGKFKEGETYCLEALQVDSTKHIAYTNLAAALLFQGKIEEAEKIYRQYKSEFKDGFLGDFAEYERLQVIPKEYMADVERIKAMLQE